jgi:5-methylcytosine-specific restriction enzyme A
VNWVQTRKVVAARDEYCVRCLREATDVHHRKVKGVGGTSDQEVAFGLANLILLCRACHSYVHQNPAEAYKTGYLVHSWDDPETIGVIRKDHRVLTFSSDGSFEQTGLCDQFLPD